MIAAAKGLEVMQPAVSDTRKTPGLLLPPGRPAAPRSSASMSEAPHATTTCLNVSDCIIWESICAVDTASPSRVFASTTTSTAAAGLGLAPAARTVVLRMIGGPVPWITTLAASAREQLPWESTFRLSRWVFGASRRAAYARPTSSSVTPCSATYLKASDAHLPGRFSGARSSSVGSS